MSTHTTTRLASRRGFLATAGGFTLTFAIAELSRVEELQAATGGQVNAWLAIGSDESVTLTIGSSEMGQGS